ncbi:hypothetical protein Lste_0526 [Legionella steelei]|uniref:Uncharacterized protein n=1 Tax=Legionella steelei TaxID=947033 RepID=A0A0W0ZNE4_9GAMM|nr:hypothetical protein [Legionella steelei]KTD70748.1 hypothetical protein Lste_0526 [Legionella steelei]
MINGTNKLDTVKQAFRHWRATRTKRGQIPDELWEQVKGLLGDYTPSKIGIHSNSDAPCSVELHRPCGSILKINAVPMSRVSKLMLDFLG